MLHKETLAENLIYIIGPITEDVKSIKLLA